MPHPDTPDTDSLHALAIRAARAGGATLLEWRPKFEAREKGPADLVTDADFASQSVVRELLMNARPDDGFVGEESEPERLQQAAAADGVRWVVDPLDGTVNYVHGFPMFATSVAAVVGSGADTQLLAGAVYDPLRDECFSASRGGGALLGDQPLRASDATELGESMVAVSLPPLVDAESPDLRGFVAVVQACRAVRRTGSAALNLAYVAAGRLDAHWAHVIKPWDAAAGVLIAEEAGAVTTASNGEPFDLWKADYLVAATPPLHAALLERMSIA